MFLFSTSVNIFCLSTWNEFLLIDFLFSFPGLCLQKMNKYLLFEAQASLDPAWATSKDNTALEPWSSPSEDGGPVCLLPCLKSSMGLLLPFFLSPLHVKYCEEIALALFRLCCLKCTAQQSSRSRCCCLPRHSIIPNSKIITTRWFTLAALLKAWKDFFLNLPFRFPSSPSTWSHWDDEKR